MADYIPRILAALKDWANNYSTKISAAPQLYGLQVSDATALASLVADFNTRYNTATSPDTQTPVAAEALRTSRAALVAKCRQLARIINADPDTTNEQRTELGLNVRDAEPTPAAIPLTRPIVRIEGAAGVQALLRITDENTPDSRRKPDGYALSAVLVKIAPASEPAPVSADDLNFAGLATRANHVLTIPAGNAGKNLWVMAQWFNERGEGGPFSAPVSSMIAA